MPDIDLASPRTRGDYAGDIYLSRCIFDGQVHVHECHQLVVPLNAPMEFETGGVSGRADLSNAVYILKGARHSFNAPTGGSFLVINMDQDYEGLLRSDAQDTSLICLAPHVARFTRYLAHEAEFNREGLLAVARPSLDMLSTMLGRPESKAVSQEKRAERLSTAYGELLDCSTFSSVSTIARRHGFSPANFRRVFREKYGLSPKAAVTRARIDHARSLLEQTDDSVKSIALSFGYENTSSFIDIFERHTGHAPAVYRSKVREQLDRSA